MVIADIGAAAIFAVLSLYCGLLATHFSVSLQSSVALLVGYNRDRARYDVGPLFWAMHTTFIPTCAYLLFIVLSYLTKVLIHISALIVRRGAMVKSPYGFTGVVIGLATALEKMTVELVKLIHSATIIS
jgi:hypothetical protein